MCPVQLGVCHGLGIVLVLSFVLGLVYESWLWVLDLGLGGDLIWVFLIVLVFLLVIIMVLFFILGLVLVEGVQI